MPETTIVLCADDFALHPAVADAVATLAECGRLSASSCMSTAPAWPAAAARARALHSRIAIGLHFNLSEPHGGHFACAQPLPQLIARAYSVGWPRGFLAEQWRRQLDDFVEHFGQLPDFIDGHQHVHQFPHVRGAMLQEVARRWGPDVRRWPRIRNTAPVVRYGKSRVIAWLGGRTLAQRLAARGVPTNAGFGGVYGFDCADEGAFDAHMRRWLAASREGTLLMCHPAASPIEGDAIARARCVEFAYLQSPAFAHTMQACQVRIWQKA